MVSVAQAEDSMKPFSGRERWLAAFAVMFFIFWIVNVVAVHRWEHLTNECIDLATRAVDDYARCLGVGPDYQVDKEFCNEAKSCASPQHSTVGSVGSTKFYDQQSWKFYNSSDLKNTSANWSNCTFDGCNYHCQGRSTLMRCDYVE